MTKYKGPDLCISRYRGGYRVNQYRVSLIQGLWVVTLGNQRIGGTFKTASKAVAYAVDQFKASSVNKIDK